jgi:hypothetical protein
MFDLLLEHRPDGRLVHGVQHARSRRPGPPNGTTGRAVLGALVEVGRRVERASSRPCCVSSGCRKKTRMERQTTTFRTVEARKPWFEAARECQRPPELRPAKRQAELSADRELA